MKYIAAIDQGTTSTRCMIFDHGGRVVASEQNEHEQIYPKPGWVEHDPLEIWARTQEVVGGALAKAGLGAGDIAALGITNQRETTLVWDRRTGEPVYNAPATDDLAQFAERGPSSLEQSTVTAFPILSSSGKALGVLSFYVPTLAPFAPALLAEAGLAAAVLGRQLELTHQPASRSPASLAEPEVVAK